MAAESAPPKTRPERAAQLGQERSRIPTVQGVEHVWSHVRAQVVAERKVAVPELPDAANGIGGHRDPVDAALLGEAGRWELALHQVPVHDPREVDPSSD